MMRRLVSATISILLLFATAGGASYDFTAGPDYGRLAVADEAPMLISLPAETRSVATVKVSERATRQLARYSRSHPARLAPGGCLGTDRDQTTPRFHPKRPLPRKATHGSADPDLP